MFSDFIEIQGPEAPAGSSPRGGAFGVATIYTVLLKNEHAYYVAGFTEDGVYTELLIQGPVGGFGGTLAI